MSKSYAEGKIRQSCQFIVQLYDKQVFKYLIYAQNDMILIKKEVRRLNSIVYAEQLNQHEPWSFR